MVAAKIPERQNGVSSSDTNDVGINMNNTLEGGKYTVVGIDIDTTGRRLIDEIVQLAAYTPNEHFEQYIMPYMNLNPAARQRHQVRVISIGFYRMLKSMQTYKIIKSKSEIAALKDFLDWLESLQQKDANSQGIILVYHEERKFIPYMILESLKKYNLLDRFFASVKSFTNGLNLAKENSNESLQHYTLRKLSKVLGNQINENARSAGDNEVNSTTDINENNLGGTATGQSIITTNHNHNDREIFDGNASVRAKLVYDVVFQLSNLNYSGSLDSIGAIDNMLSALLPHALSIEHDLNELHTQNENLERQNSFRPVFLNYFKTTLYHRVRAVKFRIILAEQGYDLQTLNDIWNEKQKDGLIEVLHAIEELKPDDKTELVDLFDSFFDPSKSTIKPIVKGNRRRNRRGLRTNMKNDGSNSARSGNEQGAGGDKQQGQQNGANPLPDSTVKSPSTQTVNAGGGSGGGGGGGSGSGKPRGRRNPRSRNNSVKTRNLQNQMGTEQNEQNVGSATSSAPIVVAN